MRGRNERFVVVALLIALVLGGVVSYWASSSPDGLEKVAADQGFAATQTRHGSSTDSPLAGYDTDGIDDPWLAGGTAGAAGVMVCFALAGGVTLVVRRRARRRDGRARTRVEA